MVISKSKATYVNLSGLVLKQLNNVYTPKIYLYRIMIDERILFSRRCKSNNKCHLKCRWSNVPIKIQCGRVFLLNYCNQTFRLLTKTFGELKWIFHRTKKTPASIWTCFLGKQLRRKWIKDWATLWGSIYYMERDCMKLGTSGDILRINTTSSCGDVNGNYGRELFSTGKIWISKETEQINKRGI